MNHGNSAADAREWVPFVALVAGILAVVALTAIPILLLQQSASTRQRITTEVLPAYRALMNLAFGMEERIAAARSGFLAADPRYGNRLAEGVAAESSAMHLLEALAPRLTHVSEDHIASLRRLVGRRDSLEASLMRADANMNEYRASLPQFDVLRDSMLMHVDTLMQQLTRATEERVAEEARRADRQRSLSTVLGAMALVAAAIVGWFAWTQGRLRREVQTALNDARRAGEQGERRREALERVTESRTRLMRGFTHDVKNPLGAAGGHLDLMIDGVYGPLSEEQARGAVRAKASISAALALVEDLLELARVESGTIEIRRRPTDLAALVRDLTAEYRAQAAASGLALEVALPASLPTAMTDARRVRQVLGNLLSNAVKYTKEGRVTVELEQPDARPPEMPGDALGIAIADTGPGIASAQKHLLFEEFVRLDPASGNGAGVGLAISQHIAQALGGRITVRSELGQGTRFTLWVPVHPVDPAASARAEAAASTQRDDQWM